MADEMMPETQDESAMPMETEAPEGQQSDIKRGEPEVDPAQRALVKQWTENVTADKKWFEDQFKRVRKDITYARLGADEAWVKSGQYFVPIVMQHIFKAVSTIYAKNPRAQAKPRKKLLFKAWDGKPESAQMALQMAMPSPMEGIPPDPNSLAIVMEIQAAKQYTQMVEKMGKTLELLWDYYTGEAYPNFKASMKKLVRRAKVCGVAYTKMSYQRILEEDPDASGQIADMTRQIAEIENMSADLSDGLIEEDSARLAQLRLSVQALQEKQYLIVREGPTFDWPKTCDIIPHRNCTDLNGFVNADYVTHEFEMDAETIQRLYKVDVKGSAAARAAPDKPAAPVSHDSSKEYGGQGEANTKQKFRVWEIHDKIHGQELTVCEGYPDFLKAPAEPIVCVEGFWRIFALTFNDTENDNEIIPLSDVYYLRHPQDEYNRARQGVREHRQQNRPKYFTRTGALQDKEMKDLGTYPSGAIIELNAVSTELTIDQIIQPHKPVAIDPAQYEVGSILQDVLVGVGTQEANLGPTGGDSATEVSVAEQGRQTSNASNVDDLDTHLSALARAFGQIALEHVNEETVLEIVGPGAVWPEMDREGAQKEVMLDIRAGSSGRPNQAAELANMERGIQYLLQIPGISPTVLGRRYGDLLNMDIDEMIIEGMPSIQAINAMAAKAAAAPAGGNDPNQQGGEGAQNGQKTTGGPPGGQPAMPPPGGGAQPMQSQAAPGGQG